MKLLGFICVLVLLFGSCDTFDTPELIPAYIEIDEFSLETSNSEGSDNENIKDCFLFVDGQFIAGYELPARIPVPMNGEHVVEIYPGIYKSGIQEDRKPYPFYTHYIDTLNLLAGETIEVSPMIGYEDDLIFWVEDFEDPFFKMTLFTTNSDTTMFIAADSDFSGLLEGDAGLIKMSSNNVYCEMRTDDAIFYDLPKDLSQDAYFEINYKCNYSFILGLLDNNSGLAGYNKTPIITFNPTIDDTGIPQWKKTYVYIPDATNFYQNATQFDFYISVLNNQAQDGIEVFVDNLKVIYRQ